MAQRDDWFNISLLEKKAKAPLLKAMENINVNRTFNIEKRAISPDAMYGNKLVPVSLLSLAVNANNLNAVEALLANGANPDGKNKGEGFSFVTPISLCFSKSKTAKEIKTSKEIFKKLILAGADINDKGLDGKTLLSRLIINTTDSDIIFYVLSKGADPNTPREFLPLVEFIIKYIDESPFHKEKEYTENIKKIVDYFLYFGVDPEIKNFSNLNAIDIINANKHLMDLDIFLPLTKSIDDIVHECRDSKILERIAKAMKIPLHKGKKKRARKSICNCIKFLRKNAESLPYDEIVERRQETISTDSPTRAAKLQQSVNDTTFGFESLYQFLGDELVIYQDPDDGKIYCFHVSEIPEIIKKKVNPWSNKVIPENILGEWLEKIEVFPEYTLETAVDKGGVFDKADNFDISIENKLEDLGRIITANNQYVNVLNLLQLPTIEIYELFRLLFGEIPGGMVPMDFNKVRHLYNANDRNGLLEYLYTVVSKAIRNNDIPISTFALYFQEVEKDFDLLKQIHRILGNDFIQLKDILANTVQINQAMAYLGDISKDVRQAMQLRWDLRDPEDILREAQIAAQEVDNPNDILQNAYQDMAAIEQRLQEYWHSGGGGGERNFVDIIFRYDPYGPFAYKN